MQRNKRGRKSRYQWKGSQTEGVRQRDIVSSEESLVRRVATIGNTSREARGRGNNRRRARRSVTCCDPVSSPLRSRLNVVSLSSFMFPWCSFAPRWDMRETKTPPSGVKKNEMRKLILCTIYVVSMVDKKEIFKKF